MRREQWDHLVPRPKYWYGEHTALKIDIEIGVLKYKQNLVAFMNISYTDGVSMKFIYSLKESCFLSAFYRLSDLYGGIFIKIHM